jgi:outer membrane receptor protein involved in Fe transport
LAANLPAQVTSAEILGTVTDASGAVIADAKVSARQLETNAVREISSDSEGRYRLPTLQPGTYEITVTKGGFARYVRGPVTLRLNQAAQLDIKLEVSSQTETVTVSSDAPLINTTNAEVGVNFDSKRISEVPLAPNRNILNLALNVAGVAQLSSGQSTFANSGNSGTDGGVNFSVNGMRTRSNNFMLDGQDSNDPSVTGLTQPVNNPDIVAEFRLITNQFAAEYGRAAGSVMNIITKSGTNDFHGTGFWFHNSNRLNSRSNVEKAARFTKAPWRINNQIGVTFGGPVLIPRAYNGKDKTFFFVSAQKWTDRRLGSGATLNGAPTEAGRAILQQFQSRPTVKALLDFVPAAAAPSGQTARFTAGGQTYIVPLGQIAGASNQTFDDWQWSARVDQRIGERNNLSGRFMWDDSTSAGTGQTTPPGNTTVNPARRMAATSALTTTVSPFTFSELRASYQRFASTTTAFDPRSQSIPSIEVNELGMTGFNAAASRTAIGLAVNLPQFRRNNTYQLQETIGMVRGSHSIKFGIDFRRMDVVSFFLPTLRGRLAYENLQDLVDDVAQVGTINAPLPGGMTNQYYKFYDYFLFVQDEWRVNNRLTLSYGIRYESPGNPIANLQAANDLIVAANNNDPRYKLSPVPARDNNNWSPRFGFNVRLPKDLILRGGYSRTYDFAFINIALNVGTAFPFLNAQTLAPRTPNSYPALQQAALRPITGNPLLITQTQVAGDFRAPYAEQFATQLQRQFGNWALSAGWVATKGTALYETTDGNPTVPGATSAAAVRRVDPNQGVRRVRANTGSSIYHSLQTSLEKRLSSGFTMGAHYTWSTFIDSSSEIFNPAVNGAVAVHQDSYNRAADRGRSIYDRPHRFTVTSLYELPMFRSQRGFAGKVLGGWQINGFLTLQSGATFTPLAGIDPGFRLSGIDGLVGNPVRPHVATGRALHRMTIDEIYASRLPTAVANSRTSLFTNVTAADPLGNAGRNTLRADGIGDLSFGAFKNTKLNERFTAQFRAEFFNLTNTRNFGSPESRINSANFANQWGTNGGNRRITLGLRFLW